LRPEKNYHRLMRAFSEASLGDDAKLIIVGDGPERENLEATALQIAANADSILPGAMASPEKIYGAFDVFSLSSDTEQAPLTILEAMAAGLPIVATDVGDIAQMVSSENKAFITSLGDERAYIDALSYLAQNPKARLVIGAANQAKVKAQYRSTMMVDAHRKLYRDIASSVPV